MEKNRAYKGSEHRLKVKLRLFYLTLIGLCILILFEPISRAESATNRNVLVLNSYHRGYKWSDDIIGGIDSLFEAGHENVRLQIEYMDTKRISDEKYFQQLYEIYRHKFRNFRFDVIISSDDNAFNFLCKYRNEIFPGTPVVFCGINDFRPSQLEGHDLFTGVNEQADFRANIEIALKMHPDTKKIVVINDRTTTGLKIHEKLMKIIPDYQDSVKFIFLEDIEMEKIREKLQRLPSDSLVFYTSFYRDRSGKFFEYDESISLIAKACNVPIYGVWDMHLGYGLVGGMLTSGYFQGEAAAKMALRILRGEKVSGIPVIKKSPNHYMFDYNQLDRFGIKPSKLPAGSIVINKPYSLYSKHKKLVWGAIASTAGLTSIIFILFFNIMKRKHAEEKLKKAHDELEQRVIRRTNDLHRQASVLDAINKIFLETLTCETDEEVARTCLVLLEDLTGSKFGFIGEINQAGRLDTIAISNPGWEACKIPKPDGVMMLKDMEIRGLWGKVIKEGKSLIVNDPDSHPDRVGTPEGHPLLTAFLGVPLRQAGKTVGMIALANKDSGYSATDQEDAEALSIAFVELLNRKRAEEALRESNQTLLTVFNSIDADVYVSDLKSHEILFMNKHMQDSFGKDLIGKQCYQVFRGKNEPCAEWTNEKLFDTNGKPGEVLIWEDQNLLTRRWYRNHDKAIKWMDDRFVRLQVATDISSLKQAEKEKERLEAQLVYAQKMESIGTLAGGIAHNFNNLLMGIQGNVSVILLDIDFSHPHHGYLMNIEKQVKSGAKLTNQLLGYAREGRYEIKPISLNHLVKETSDTFGLAKKEIEIHREFAENLFGIEADQGQIEQLLLNLYVNAADAMPRGGDLFLKTMNVTNRDIRGKPYEPKPGKYVLLTVRDTGAGMDRKTMNRIFEPFFTTKGLARGTGLGMASVYGIIKGHGGYIDVDSEKGYGTTFSIYLPATEKRIKEEKRLPVELVTGKETVLLVDDEEIVLDAGEQMLKALGYEVLSTGGGQEALELYKKNQDRIDMVLLDMVMPGMGGGETYDRMKEVNPEIQVLLSSGYSIDGQATEILKRGCNGFIQKPFNMKQLSQKLREILDKE